MSGRSALLSVGFDPKTSRWRIRRTDGKFAGRSFPSEGEAQAYCDQLNGQLYRREEQK